MTNNYKTPPHILTGYSFAFPLLVSLIILLINPFSAVPANAQDTARTKQIKTPAQLSEQEWKAVEGIFQSSGNKDMYVQFTARESALVAKLLWNNNEIHLIPESVLAFTSKEEGDEGPIHITFAKDSTGYVNQVTVANNGVWNRTKEYKPVVKKEMDHTPEQLKPFEGLYQLQNDKTRFIQFTVNGNNLILKQHWDGNEIPFVPESELNFFCKTIPQFALAFTKGQDGNITQALAFGRDLWIKTKKINLTLTQLKIFEGKYQFKDDPDNFIQIIARDHNLVVKQLWDGKEIVVEPMTETYFYNKDQSYPLQIIQNDDGIVKQVLVLGVDVFDKVKK